MSAPGQVDGTLHEGVGIDRLLLFGALAGLIGWLVTGYAATRPGLALSTVGVDGGTALVIGWLIGTLCLAVIGLTFGARAVRYSPTLWLWGVLITLAFLANLLVLLTNLVPLPVGRYLVWHPWPVVYAVGFLATGTVASSRFRSAYLLGTVAAVVLLLAGTVLPGAAWLYGLTGLLHAGPLLADVLTSTDAPPTDDANVTNS